MKRFKKIMLRAVVVLLAIYGLLLVPDTAGDTIHPAAGQTAFAWNQDAFWLQMEQEFKAARKMPAADLDTVIGFYQRKLVSQLFALADSQVNYNDPRLGSMQQSFFHAAAYAAAAPDPGWYVRSSNVFRSFIKQQSQHWDVKDTAVKNALYKLLYGLRAATEEVLLQTNAPFDPANVLIQPEYSAAPFTTVFGVKVHSGDLLVSRGGAEVSALISRGNDYPGNFSHVALIYVEAGTNQPYLIEAHIEKGVALSSVEQYVKDKKLRFMVLRLRGDLPAMQQDSLLPHKAAQAAYEAAQRRHIPYDFKMNFYDSSAMFCSEVASYAYKTKGLQLWQNISTISAPGVVNWLHDFGVENFVTQMPSDLEYDPQLSIVAEWRDPETLYKDHIDNAAMDAMLEKANQGQTISYNRWMLPVARCIKAWSWICNRFGKEGVIPEGMSATRALKNQTFVAMHQTLKEKLLQQAAAFHQQNGYRPPYWQLVKFAQGAAE